MKSAYELAMERLNKQSPTLKLTPEKKRQLAELDAEYKAKIADREILINGQIEKAVDKGDAEAVGLLQKQLISDRKTIQAALEEKKDAVRQGGA